MGKNFPWDLGLRRETDRARWLPRTDVYATDVAYVFEMDLPGVDREDDEDDASRTYHRVERLNGSFERSYVLPDGVFAESVTADYEKGTLRITVSMPEGSGPEKRSIEIN